LRPDRRPRWPRGHRWRRRDSLQSSVPVPGHIDRSGSNPLISKEFKKLARALLFPVATHHSGADKNSALEESPGNIE